MTVHGVLPRSTPGAHARRRGLALRAQALLLFTAGMSCALAGLIAAPARLGGRGSLVLTSVGLALLILSYARAELARRWLIGAAGERGAARPLRRLERRGWVALHDVPRPRGGNLDHILVGPPGVITIETKTTRYGSCELRQAAAGAAWLSRYLGVPVTPVLCVVRRRVRPHRRGEVLVVDVSRLGRVLSRLEGAPVDVDAVLHRMHGGRRAR